MPVVVKYELDIGAFSVMDIVTEKHTFVLTIGNIPSIEMTAVVSEWIKKLIADNIDGLTAITATDPKGAPTSSKEH